MSSETVTISDSNDVVLVRQAVRSKAVGLGFSLVDQTKIVTAASELARNTLDYGGGGLCTLNVVERDSRRGLQLVFADEGPGIPNVELALQDGYTTGKGMGMGLSGSRRLVNEFDIQTEVGKGTRVTIIKWK